MSMFGKRKEPPTRMPRPQIEPARPYIKEVRQPEAVRQFAPVSRDPVRLSSMTLEAVNKIGGLAADEIDDVAKALEAGAHEVAEIMRAIANKMREQTELAAAQLVEYCDRANLVVAGMHDLEKRLLNKQQPEQHRADADDGAPIPKFLHDPLQLVEHE